MAIYCSRSLDNDGAEPRRLRGVGAVGSSAMLADSRRDRSVERFSFSRVPAKRRRERVQLFVVRDGQCGNQRSRPSRLYGLHNDDVPTTR